jgi:hypothetical protein
MERSPVPAALLGEDRELFRTRSGYDPDDAVRADVGVQGALVNGHEIRYALAEPLERAGLRLGDFDLKQAREGATEQIPVN